MRRTTLHDYLSQIEGLLNENRLPEAAAHCHFILQQYPRHIDTYRLFGRALLEQRLFDEATDVFERSLSADPEDLITHAGLALAYTENQDLERAVWHMERAFEIDPYNRAVQDELRKLYIARDGDAPPRLSLTTAALARLHLRAALYRQATDELKLLINENPQRPDLQLMLAESLYWDSRRVEAAEMCKTILDALPFCIKANAMMADFWLQNDGVDKAKEHLQRVQELTLLDQAHLDPETVLGRALSSARIRLPELIQVEVLDDSEVGAKPAEELTSRTERATLAVIDDEELPEWLLEVASPEAELEEDSLHEVESDEKMAWLEEVDVADLETTAAPDTAAPAPVETDSGAEVFPGDEFLEPFEDDERSGLLAREPAVVKPQAEGESWDDESLMALDELEAIVDADSESATTTDTAPEWLGELANGSDATEELPDWLYEAVGLEDDLVAEDKAEVAGPSEEPALVAPAAPSDQPGEQEATPPASDKRHRADRAQHDRALEELEAELMASEEEVEVPDWLLEGDAVLDEFPEGLLDEEAARRPDAAEFDPEASIWLDELSEQLGTIDDESSSADEVKDE